MNTLTAFHGREDADSFGVEIPKLAAHGMRTCKLALYPLLAYVLGRVAN